MLKEASCRTKIVPSRCMEPLRTQEPQEVIECVYYCCQTLTKPLITGFDEIAKSKRSRRRASKLLVFLICMSGFFYQTWAFLELYLAYPTLQDTSEDYPEEITAPAVTICNHNRLLRRRLCAHEPIYCNWNHIDSWMEFCENHKRWCRYNEGKWEEFEDFHFAWPDYDGYYKFDNRNLFLNLIGPQNETDLIEYCTVFKDGVHVDCNSSTMIQAPKNGLPHKCFSLFSLLGKPNEESLKLSSSHRYLIILQMYPEEYVNENDLVQAWVVVHDAHKSVNPMSDGVPLTAGKIHKLFLSMEQKVSLPPPYASKCEDYMNEWKRNGGYGPLSKRDCIEVCLMKAMVKKSGCVGQEISYPNNFTICKDQYYVTESNMLKKCSSICQDPCEEIIYSFKTQEVHFSQTCHPKDERCQFGLLVIQVQFNRMTVQKFQHIPKFESIELFSYIGGYLGMWLGIALASMFDFSEIMYDTVYPLLKGRKKRKKTAPFEEFRHQTV